MDSLTTGIVSLLGASGLISLVVWLAYKSGKNHVVNENNIKAKEVANDQAQIAVNRPSKSDVVNSLRNNEF